LIKLGLPQGKACQSPIGLDSLREQSVSDPLLEPAMDLETAREATSLIATLIGEIMEDHVMLALSAGDEAPADWPAVLEQAGEDIADLGKAIAVIARRGQIDQQAL
jgi:hypothetical protein